MAIRRINDENQSLFTIPHKTMRYLSMLIEYASSNSQLAHQTSQCTQENGQPGATCGFSLQRCPSCSETKSWPNCQTTDTER